MRFFGRKEMEFERPLPPARVTLDVLGFVRNSIRKPQPNGWERIESRIEMKPGHLPKLEGLSQYSHIIVVFYLDLADEAPEKPDRLTLASGHTYGILATRSQLRPNHLGVSAVPLLSIQGRDLTVRGLDAIDGTPILDIKPYLPEYDAFPGATIPS
ncbi:MAG: SAM-dependent methyltransferase [Dehalococcoidia bacterium]